MCYFLETLLYWRFKSSTGVFFLFLHIVENDSNFRGNSETFETLAALQNDINTAKKETVMFPLLEAIKLNGYGISQRPQ